MWSELLKQSGLCPDRRGSEGGRWPGQRGRLQRRQPDKELSWAPSNEGPPTSEAVCLVGMSVPSSCEYSPTCRIDLRGCSRDDEDVLHEKHRSQTPTCVQTWVGLPPPLSAFQESLAFAPREGPQSTTLFLFYFFFKCYNFPKLREFFLFITSLVNEVFLKTNSVILVLKIFIQDLENRTNTHKVNI